MSTTNRPGPSEEDPGETRRVQRLRDQLAESRRLYDLAANPLLRVVNLERMRVSATRSMWFFLALGLGFTTTGVQDFLAGNRPITDPVWWGCWLVEPALAGILITLLRWEADMLAEGVPIPDGPVRWLKRLLLGSTLVMNVYPTLRPRTGHVNAGMIFVHVVIPLVVFLIAEVMPIIQQTFAQAKQQAQPATPVQAPAPADVPRPSEQPAAPTTRIGLPAPMLQTLETKKAELAAQGRLLTAEDVQTALKVPADFAAKIITQLAAVPASNGQPSSALTKNVHRDL